MIPKEPGSMAELAQVSPSGRAHVLDGLTGDPRAHLAAPMARFSLRLPDAAIDAAATALGLALAGPINRAASTDGRTAIRLGPDEWLILFPEAESDTVAKALDHALEDGIFALVDIGHRQIGIELTGDATANMISAGCPLDLDFPAFPVGMATRTVFLKTEIVLWRTGRVAFHIEVWRSFAPYLWALLTEIGREYPGS
jgi:sarcosine oxidase, subunit gamma